MKILVAIEQFNPEAKKILERVGDVEYRTLTQDILKDAVKECDVAVVGLGLCFNKDILDSAPNLNIVATATTGLDHIDVAYAQEKGIAVLSLQDEDLKEVTGTAELAFGLILALVRRIPESYNDVRMGNWGREKFLGHNLSGKTLGIVGLGRLGSMMAKYGKAFGMRVIAHDPYKDDFDSAQLVDFNILLSESDIISIHAPLNEETKGMFGASAFNQMKNSAFLVNTSRGDIVNENDLLTALNKKTIAGYAADVLSGETEFKKNAAQNRLVRYSQSHNNMILTPHIGGFTKESRTATDVIIAKKLALSLPNMDTQRDKKPVIIVGSTRSGTKLISRIIGGHPDNFLITEHREKFHIPEDQSGICEEFLWMNNFEYKSWSKNGMPNVKVPIYKEDDIARMREIYLKAAGNKRLVIKNPQNVMRVKFIKKMFPDALYIFCLRNPWHGAQSRLLAGNANYQLASQKNFDLPDDLLLKSVFSWKESIDLFQREKNENWHAVRYENTVFETKDTVKGVFEFLGMRDDPEYFEKACRVSKDLKHKYYPMKRAFSKSKYKKEIMDMVREGCKVFPYDQPINSVHGSALQYYFTEVDGLPIKKIKTNIIKSIKQIIKKIIRAIFCLLGKSNTLYVSPIIFGALSKGASTLITQENDKLRHIAANSRKSERVSFDTFQMQYYRLKHYKKVVVMDNKGKPWILLKNIDFSPSNRYNHLLTGEVEYIRKYAK